MVLQRGKGVPPFFFCLFFKDDFSKGGSRIGPTLDFFFSFFFFFLQKINAVVRYIVCVPLLKVSIFLFFLLFIFLTFFF